MNIQSAISAIADTFEAHRFTNGDCHHLAVAIREFNAGQGKLFGCIRQSVTTDGSVYAETYSHMVYECPEKKLWDIDGCNADVRWEEQWTDEPDEDGLVSEFKWIEVQPLQVESWLQRWRVEFNPAFVGEIGCVLSQLPGREHKAVKSNQIEFEEIDTGNGSGALRGCLPAGADAVGNVMVTSVDGWHAPDDLETGTFLIGLHGQRNEGGRFVTVAGRKGLNDWYEEFVGYRPDDDAPAPLEIRSLLAQTAEMMFYHLVNGEPKMNAPVENEAVKVAPTYLTARFKDIQNKDGATFRKNVVNLFYHGGNDSRGLPVLSNNADKIMGLVNKAGAKLDLFHTDEHGDVLKDGDVPAKPFLSVGLGRFVAEGTDPKQLEADQGALTGPAAAGLVECFKAVIASKPEKTAKATPGM